MTTGMEKYNGVTQRHGDGQRTEGDVAQAVADHGIPFQNQRNA